MRDILAERCTILWNLRMLKKHFGVKEAKDLPPDIFFHFQKQRTDIEIYVEGLNGINRGNNGKSNRTGKSNPAKSSRAAGKGRK